MEPRGRDAQSSIFAGVMVAPRPRTVRGLNAYWPRGSKYSPRRGKAANKEKGARALRVKVREYSQMYRPPNPPEKFKKNLSVWLARLKPPRVILRLCSPHCSPEENPGDAIARAVLGPCVSWMSFRNVSPGLNPGQSRLGCSVGDTCQDANPAGSRYYPAVEQKSNKKKREFHVLNHITWAFLLCFFGVNNLYLDTEKTRSGAARFKSFPLALDYNGVKSYIFIWLHAQDAI